MNLLKEIQFVKTIINSSLSSLHYNLEERIESVLIYLFLTRREIIELKGLEDNNYKVLLVGESIEWDFGYEDHLILEAFESSNSISRQKPDLFDKVKRFIRSLLTRINFYFYLDELFMDGYLQTESTGNYYEPFPSNRRILIAPNSRIYSICKWLSKENKSYRYTENNKRTVMQKLNQYFNIGLISNEISIEHSLYENVTNTTRIFKHPIPYGVRE